MGRTSRLGEPLQNRERFDYDVRKASARPSNTSIRGLVGNEGFKDMVMGVLENTKIVMVK